MTIDYVYLSVDEMARTAHAIAIQITIAKTNSEDKFYQNWTKWTGTLSADAYTIRATFVWLVEEGRRVAQVPVATHNTRSGHQWGVPQYDILFLWSL